MPSRAAIALFGRPSARSSRTSISRGDVAADAVAEQQVEEIFRRLDRMAVEIEHHVADQQPGGVGRAAGGDAHDEQRLLAAVGAALAIRQADRLTREPEITAFHAT